MFRRKQTLEDKITELVIEEFAGIILDLERDHREYRRRLELKEQTRGALDNAESRVQRLHLDRIELKKRFWEAYYEKQDEVSFSEIESESRLLERATKKAEKSLERARPAFEKAGFDEVAEGFSLRAKANIAEEEADHRIDALEETLKDLLAGIRRDVKEASQALREEYEEPRFETSEDKNAHVKRMIEVLNTVAESYTPDFHWPQNTRENMVEPPQGTGDAESAAEDQAPKKPRPWWRRMLPGRS